MTIRAVAATTASTIDTAPALKGFAENCSIKKILWGKGRDELADWRSGRDAIYQLAALTVRARLAVADG